MTLKLVCTNVNESSFWYRIRTSIKTQREPLVISKKRNDFQLFPPHLLETGFAEFFFLKILEITTSPETSVTFENSTSFAISMPDHNIVSDVAEDGIQTYSGHTLMCHVI
jgi:hypothetical protein